MSKFTEAVEHYLEGLEAVSAGACPGCEECGLGEEPTDHEYECASYGDEFSWSPCECCGSSLGGSQHPAHGIIPKGSHPHDNGQPWPLRDLIVHMDVCVDCLMYLANGDEPDPEQWS